ncbi:bifunctional DNA-formamidopyrimidine glycosylase/DNA-(apurinic or apyrimidinic site) lyase [Methyloligella solikamskensis]|uniref:Formamidopyrimidine-DNA glycosylase n=1 Tax=Methyloligella solikamskensis TaxID=1177756 RepID=A0ABW3JCM1_9HYPH
MPELPEVETVRLGLAPFMVGKTIESVEQRRADLRFPLPANFAVRLTGRRIEAMDRRAKYILARLDDGEVLVMHLGMTGRFTVDEANGTAVKPGVFAHTATEIPRHEHIVFHLQDGAAVRYADARRFGYMALVPEAEMPEHPLFKGLGIEPLGEDFTPEALASVLAGAKTPLKAALLDQRRIAGLGNIYVCEALYDARLSPVRLARTIVTKDGEPTARCARLAHAISRVLNDAIAAGGSSLRDYAHADGSLGRFQHSFKVYGREGKPCPDPECQGLVKRIVQSGRSTFYCPSCQR